MEAAILKISADALAIDKLTQMMLFYNRYRNLKITLCTINHEQYLFAEKY